MYKKIALTFTTLLISVSAFAGSVDSSSSWDDIYEARLWPAFNKIQIEDTFFPLINLCVDGDHVRAIKPEGERCVRYRNQGHEQVCVEYAPVYYSRPITFQETVCTQWSRGSSENHRCIREETRTSTLKLAQDVPVYSRWNRESGETLEFHKEFTVPACQ